MAVRALKIGLVTLLLVGAFYSGIRFGPPLFDGLWLILRPGGNGPPDGLSVKPGDPEYEMLFERVSAAAEVYRAEPVAAVYNSAYHTVVPELNGYELDVEATVALLAAAEPGRDIAPVWRELLPEVTLKNYPHAIIERGHPALSSVTLMINVAWGNEYLPEMLSILEQHAVKTTFFPVGRWAERFPELLQEIDSRGHELGNHGYDDSQVMTVLDKGGAVESLRKTNEVIARLTGQEPRYFTPHKGEYNTGTRDAAALLEMRLLLWTLDTVDWQRPGEAVMAKRILDNLVPGAIILMHPTEQSAGFLHLVLPEIKEMGYRVVPVSELLSPTPQYPDVKLQR